MVTRAGFTVLSTISCKFPLFPFHWTSDDKGHQLTTGIAKGVKELGDKEEGEDSRERDEGLGGTWGAGEGEGEHRRGHMTRGG